MDANQIEKLLNEKAADLYDVIGFALGLAEGQGAQAAVNFLMAWNCESDDYLRAHWPEFAELEAISGSTVRASISDPESVPIPTTVNMARMMVGLGCSYLKDHAPEHLAAPAAGTVGRDAAQRVEKRISNILMDSQAEWGDACGGPEVHEIFAYRLISAMQQEIDAAIEAHTKAGKANA